MTDKLREGDLFVAKTSFILRALGLLGLEEILNLSEVASEQKIPLKKAAGEDLLAWSGPASKKKLRQEPEEEARILSFPKKSAHDFGELEDPNRPQPAKDDGEKPSLVSSDMLLWQREISKETGGAIKRVDAVSGYQKSTQMYVIKTESPEGKQRIRFASTDGVLVNKKQS